MGFTDGAISSEIVGTFMTKIPHSRFKRSGDWGERSERESDTAGIMIHSTERSTKSSIRPRGVILNR